MKWKRVVASILVAVMMFSLAACGSSSSSDDSADDTSEAAAEETEDSSDDTVVSEITYTDDGRTIVKVAMQADMTNESPWLSSDGKGRKYIIYSVYESLAMLSGLGGELEPVLAKSWSTEDNLTYEIELYDYIYDSEGNHITVDDVIFSFEEAAEPKVRNLKYVESIEKVDDYNFIMTLNSTDVAVFERIMFQTAIVSQTAYEESGDDMATQAVATGPYVITEWVTGSSVTLEKNENYWQTDESCLTSMQYANVDVIEFEVITEASQQLIGIETGDVDIVSGLSYSDVAAYEDSDEYVIFETLDQNMRQIDFNCSDESLCSDINLRMAIAYAIDAEGLLEGVLDGHGEVSKGMPSNMGDYVEALADLDYYEYDPDLAMEYLEKSSYDGSTLVLMTDTDEVDTACAEMILNYLDAVGISAEITALDTAILKDTKLDYTAWDFEVYYAGSSDYYTTQWRTTWISENQSDGLLPIGINDDTLESLIAAAANVETFSDETVMAFVEYQQLEMCYNYSLVTPSVYVLARDYMEEVVLNDGGWLLPGSCIYTWNE